MYVDDINIGWKETKHWSDVESYSTKKSIWENQHLSLDHVYLGCTQRQCEISKDIVDNYRAMFESRISAVRSREITIPSKSSYFFMVLWHEAGHAKKRVERYCELANKTTQQLHTVSTPFIDDHHFKEELKSVWELSKVCSQIVLKCLYLARIGWPDILRSVNKLARSITKWTKACDKRLSRFDILHPSHMWI